ncbi:pheromone A receptor-domain-containing protein [Tricladium varicosporioides]|nr:pheromone A receptor-domain-containing protein [Hymenoscyphus varicosporioides]
MSNSVVPQPLTTGKPIIIPVSTPPTYKVISTNAANAVCLPVFGSIAIVIMFMPFRDFYRKGNLAACSFIITNTYLCLLCVINPILWPNDDWSTWFNGVGYCDIVVQTRFAFSIATLAGVAVFIKNLAMVFYSKRGSLVQSRAKKRRGFIIDFLLIWFVPIVEITSQHFFSIGRYAILPVWGCYSEFDASWPYVALYFFWLPFWTFFSIAFAAMLGVGLWRYRQNIGNTLASSGSGMSSKYFVKLSILSIAVVMIYVPLNGYFAYLNKPNPYHLHFDYKTVHNPLVWDPILYFTTSISPNIQYNMWTTIIYQYIIFIFFGLNNESINTYRKWLVALGFGHYFPTLKGPRMKRGSSQHHRSTLEKLDLVEKCMKFFDRGLSNSQVPGDCSAVINSSDGRGSRHNSSSSQSDIAYNKSTRPQHQGFLRSFRTHIFLPFPFYHSTTNSKTCTRIDTTTTSSMSVTNMTEKTMVGSERLPIAPNKDIEANTSHFGPPSCGAVSTNIWSDGTQAHPGQPLPLPNEHGRGSSGTNNPRMGTREYRERERRERELLNGIDCGERGGVQVERIFEVKEDV